MDEGWKPFLALVTAAGLGVFLVGNLLLAASLVEERAFVLTDDRRGVVYAVALFISFAMYTYLVYLSEHERYWAEHQRAEEFKREVEELEGPAATREWQLKREVERLKQALESEDR